MLLVNSLHLIKTSTLNLFYNVTGSLFNHSDNPNVSYTLDPTTDSIRYTTVRDVNSGEELCVFYGHTLWFMPAAQSSNCSTHIALSEAQVDDGCGGLSAVEPVNDNLFVNPYLEGNPDEIIPEEDLPFTRCKLPPEEEEVGSIRTGTHPTRLDILFTVSDTISTSMGCRYSRPASYHDTSQVRICPFSHP